MTEQLTNGAKYSYKEICTAIDERARVNRMLV